MSFKTLLIHVRSDLASDDALRTAVAFAQSQDANLIGLGARARILVEDPGLAYLDGTTLQAIVDQEVRDGAETHKRFSTLTRALGERAHWRARRDFPTTALIEEAAGADIILAGLEREPSDVGIDVATIVCESGLPVLALPPGGDELRLRSIVVAWRNTREARRALSCALPLLKQAEQVHLLQVAPVRDADEAWAGLNAAVARLARHGVKASAETRPCADAAAEALLDEGQARAADLLVVGAYGHSRAREWVLGGVTKALLAGSSIPLFLAH